MNSVLVIFSVTDLFAISQDQPVIYAEQVFVQGRLNGVDVTIRVTQMGIISIHSWYRVRYTIGQVIDIYRKKKTRQRYNI